MVNIYMLRCPITGAVKYVGKTKMTLKQRLAGHGVVSSNKKNRAWHIKLKKKKLRPIIELLCVSQNRDGDAMEFFWILYFRECRFQLSNIR